MYLCRHTSVESNIHYDFLPNPFVKLLCPSEFKKNSNNKTPHSNKQTNPVYLSHLWPPHCETARNSHLLSANFICVGQLLVASHCKSWGEGWLW